jgi:hypothetical protein
MTKIVNLIAGPSSGKTSIANKMVGIMKEKRVNVEYVEEFAKKLVISGSPSINDQFYIIANQYHNIFSLVGKVDYIVTDGPLIVGIPYIWYEERNNPYYGESCCQHSIRVEDWKTTFEDLVLKSHFTFKNINFFVDRKGISFSTDGRLENEEQSKEIDRKLIKFMRSHFIEYETVSAADDLMPIVEKILNEHKQRQK